MGLCCRFVTWCFCGLLVCFYSVAADSESVAVPVMYKVSVY